MKTPNIVTVTLLVGKYDKMSQIEIINRCSLSFTVRFKRRDHLQNKYLNVSHTNWIHISFSEFSCFNPMYCVKKSMIFWLFLGFVDTKGIIISADIILLFSNSGKDSHVLASTFLINFREGFSI